MENILFINACVRDSSRTLILARDLLSKLSGEVPTEVTGDVVTEMSEKTKGEVTELRLEEEKIEPLSKDSLEKRDRLLAAGKTEDDFFCYARQFAQADCIVIAAPYWDLAFPALLKSYLEAPFFQTLAILMWKLLQRICMASGRPPVSGRKIWIWTG